MLRKYFNIGIAVDTKDGLLVPVIKEADNLNITEVANEIIMLAEKAKNKKLLGEEFEWWYLLYIKPWSYGRCWIYAHN